MKELQLDIFATDELETVVSDLIATNKQFYNLIIEKADVTGNDAGRLELKELATFAEYLDKDSDYYTAELIYMIQYAMDGVTAD